MGLSEICVFGFALSSCVALVSDLLHLMVLAQLLGYVVI